MNKGYRSYMGEVTVILFSSDILTFQIMFERFGGEPEIFDVPIKPSAFVEVFPGLPHDDGPVSVIIDEPKMIALILRSAGLPLSYKERVYERSHKEDSLPVKIAIEEAELVRKLEGK